MEMDDPWGSPWADEVQLTHSNKTPVKEDDDLARPTTLTTTIKASSSALRQQTNTSPWEDVSVERDDNEVGKWADVPTKAGVGLDGAIDGWVGDISDTADNNLHKSPMPVNDGFKLRWNDASLAQEEPVAHLAPSLLTTAVEVVRQPSPDPWGFGELSSPRTDVHDTYEGAQEEDVKSNATIVDLDMQESASAEHKTQGSTPKLLDNLLDTNEAVELDLNYNNKPESNANLAKSAQFQENELPLSDSAINPVRLSITQDADPTSSRPSSAPSDGSRHDDTFVESPRTSLDDEPKRIQTMRQASKVQELVEHFDTLAKREETPGLEDGRISAAGGSTYGPNNRLEDVDNEDEGGNEQDEETDANMQNESEDSDDDFGDFGDFEEGQSDANKTVAARTDLEAVVAPPSTNPKPITKRAKSGTPKDGIPISHGPVEFIPNISLLDKMYPELQDDPTPEKIFIPDVIPHDSFSSTEERKMWYRVSRYGPMRKHESGDDENYVRVNWVKSQVREETLKVVARWIEEDRISGRVVLGGGSKAGSMFGWNDSKSTPASIAVAFAERNPRKKKESVGSFPITEIPREWPKGLVRERSISKGRSTSKPRRRSSIKPVRGTEDAAPGKVDAPVPAGADFGWSSEKTFANLQSSTSPSQSSHKVSGSISRIVSVSKPSSPAPHIPLKSKHASIKSVSKTSDLVPQSVFPASKSDTIIPPPSPKSAIPDSTLAKAEIDADDDWGEMISSPVVGIAPMPPVQNTLHHKRSQSFGNIPPVNPTQPLVRAPLDQNHRPVADVDQILTPGSVSAQPASPPAAPDTTSKDEILSPPQIPSPQPLPGSNITTSISQTSNSDVWASADFSFFDTAPASVSVPVPNTKHIPKAVSTPASSFANLNAVVSSPVAPNTKRSKEEMAQDKIVEGILKNLPDLSYMLKR
jgi:hypothetical protein